MGNFAVLVMGIAILGCCFGAAGALATALAFVLTFVIGVVIILQQQVRVSCHPYTAEVTIGVMSIFWNEVK